MTPEEAIKIARTIMPVRFKHWKAIKTLINCAEKQIPKKPKQYVGEYVGESWPVCPKCSLELMPNGEKYCSDCGQAINWEEKSNERD